MTCVLVKYIGEIDFDTALVLDVTAGRPARVSDGTVVSLCRALAMAGAGLTGAVLITHSLSQSMSGTLFRSVQVQISGCFAMSIDAR